MALDFANDMDNIFLTCGFEEDVVHVSPSAVETTVKAIVFRGSGPESFSLGRGQQSGDISRYPFEVYISASAVTGIQLNKTAFKILEKATDATKKSHLVAKIISSDSGGYRLGLA